MSYPEVKEEITRLIKEAGDEADSRAIIDRALGAYAPLYHAVENGETPEGEWDIRVEAIRDWEQMRAQSKHGM